MLQEPKRYDSRAWTGDISPGPASEVQPRRPAKPAGPITRFLNRIFPALFLLAIWGGSLSQLVTAQTEHRIRLRHHYASLHSDPGSYTFAVILNMLAFLGTSAVLIGGMVMLWRQMKARRRPHSR